MQPRLYLETTVPSYLTASPSRDLIVAAHQQVTREWWERRRSGFDLFISQVVLEEMSGGDPGLASRRLQVVAGLPILEIDPKVADLAKSLMERVPLPRRAAADSVHIAAAVVHGMDFLLTWNCAHLANASLRGKIEDICRARGFTPPVICTPEELLEE